MPFSQRVAVRGLIYPAHYVLERDEHEALVAAVMANGAGPVAYLTYLEGSQC